MCDMLRRFVVRHDVFRSDTTKGEAMRALLTPEELAELLSVPTRTLDQWRYYGRGPQFIKIGRHCRYRPEAIDAWLAAQSRGGAEAVSHRGAVA
jgi:excisionase family DNA binding protein